MKKKKRNFKLTPEEQLIESEIEHGEWKPAPDKLISKLKSEMVQAAKSHNKDARVNLRLNADDVTRIREKAELEGIPYQTLIASVLHKYATDQLLDEKAVMTVIHKLSKKIAS